MSMLARSAPPEAEQQAEPAAADNPYRANRAEWGDHRSDRRLHGSHRPAHVVEAGWLTARRARRSIRSSARRGERSRIARVILLRASGVKRDDLFRWLPTDSELVLGRSAIEERPDGPPDLEYYEATFRSRPRRLAMSWPRSPPGAWKTEVSNDGKGGTGHVRERPQVQLRQGSPSFGARPGSMTVFAVAHNFFGQDRRLVAVDHDGKTHPAVSYSSGSDGDKKWVIDIDRCRIRLAARPDQGIPGPVPADRGNRDQGHRPQPAIDRASQPPKAEVPHREIRPVDRVARV